MTGKLDVVVIEAGSKLKLAHHAYGLRKGGIGEQEGVTKVRCSQAEVELEGVEGWNVDGELIEAGTSSVPHRPEPGRSRGGIGLLPGRILACPCGAP